MAPFRAVQFLDIGLFRRSFDPEIPSQEFLQQWSRPGDVFSVLLILGGDVVSRALAQLVGHSVTPVTFSFGWVAYAIAALISAIGDHRLMPPPDCRCKVINGNSGYVRDNASWVLGRIMRDFDTWKDVEIEKQLQAMLDRKHKEIRAAANKEEPGSGAAVWRPTQAGLCLSVYTALPATPGRPAYDLVYWSGFATAIVQIGVAAIPCGLYGDWSILLITGVGILLSFLTGSLPQWRREKWACRDRSKKTCILTKGNGSQHAIMIVGNNVGLDLEDLATSDASDRAAPSLFTITTLLILALFWILLLITAAGIKNSTWFLLAVGGIGILQNIFAASWRRTPAAFGMPLMFKEVITQTKTMETLFLVEERYPFVGQNLVDTYFPGGKLRPDEQKKWDDLIAVAHQPET